MSLRKKKDLLARKMTYYRGGGEGSMPKGKSANDVVLYETKELGNKLKIKKGEDLRRYPAERLSWVTKDKKDARQYGDVEKVTIGKHRILARDSMGGYLLHRDG